MKLLRLFALSGVQTLSKLVFGFALVKIVAVEAGPAGLGLFNQFQTFAAILAVLVAAPVSTGLVRYAAESSSDDDAKAALFSTALRVALASSLICAVLLQVFAAEASHALFGSDGYRVIIRLVGVSNAVAVLNILLSSILNGQGEFRRLLLTNIASNFLGLVLGVAGMYFDGVPGAMLGYVFAQVVSFAVAVLAASGAPGILARHFARPVDRAVFRQLTPYALATLVTSISLPVVEFLLRNHIADRHSWIEAGYWQGLSKYSDAYLLIINSFLAIHLMPALSRANTAAEIRRVLLDTAKIVLPVASAMAAVSYLLRGPIVLTLFSSQFGAMREWFGMQMLGDVLRVAAAFNTYVIITKLKRSVFAISEFLFAAGFLISGIMLVDRIGWGGAVYAFALAHLIYIAITSVLVARVLRS